ncbi:(3R)-hydroxymyristoyl-ACP dehydratase [Pragia fontium]|uniref:Dehydratase n=1 Tax=Pragia fontium TaxID=82985 RepID=A0ABQ5LKI1_9GAMM|nr:hotdog family protein [Pragia fontium]GKX63754.1 dehydratase [Pragia fontium]SUB84252.1 (3R)-hydroxymyristoyl-ACP dehydratase [Pragia fontium]
MNNFHPAAYYLPHESPMVFLETVCAVDDDSAICEVSVNPDGILSPYLNGQNALPAWFAIEIMAQAIGVWSGWHGIQNNQTPRLGMLLGSRAFKSTLNEYPNGSLLRVYATMLLQDDKLASFDCRLEINGETVTQAKLNVYQPDNQEIARLIQQPNVEDAIL